MAKPYRPHIVLYQRDLRKECENYTIDQIDLTSFKESSISTADIYWAHNIYYSFEGELKTLKQRYI